MKLFGIFGSPRRAATDWIIKEALRYAMRAFAASNPHALTGNVGAAVADGGDRIGGQELAIRAITDLYVINEMIHVGGGAFGANLGATFWSKDKGAAGVKGVKKVWRAFIRR